KRARDGMYGCFVVVDGELCLWRRAEKLEVAVIKIKQVWRWINGTQCPIYIELVAQERSSEAAGWHNLKDVSPMDMFFHFFDQGFEIIPLHIGGFPANQ